MAPRRSSAHWVHALVPLLAFFSATVTPVHATAIGRPMDTSVDAGTNFGVADVGSSGDDIVTMVRGGRARGSEGLSITPISPELIPTLTPRLSTRSTTTSRRPHQQQQQLQHQFIIDHAEQQLIEDGFLPKPQQQLLDQSIQQQQLLQQSLQLKHQQQQHQHQQQQQQHNQQPPPLVEALPIQHQFQLSTRQPQQQHQQFLEQLPQEHQQFLEPLPQEHQQFAEQNSQQHQQLAEPSQQQQPTSQPPKQRQRAKEISTGRKTSNTGGSGGRCFAGFTVRKGLVKPDEHTNSGRVYFQDVVTNAGGWVKDRQQFEAPCTGLYYFSFNAVSTEKQDFTIALMKDGVYQVTAYGGKDGYQWGANTALLFLNEGEPVYLELQQGGIYEHPFEEAYTSFTGFLVNQL